MDISVIICSYNRCNLLRNVLECIINLDIPFNLKWEVLVVDNNSTDQTKYVISEYVSKKPDILKYIYEYRPGKSFALNAGICHAKGNIIAFTDDDVTIDRKWICNIIRAFETYDCTAIGGRIIPAWSDPIPYWYTDSGKYKLMAAIVKFDYGEEPCLIETSPWGANMAFKRFVFEKYGMFRTDLGPNPNNMIRGEDTEFCKRIIIAKEKLYYIPDVLIYHPVEKFRTKKNYIKKWYLNYGRALIRKDGIPVNTINIFHVPLYLYKALIVNVIRWISSFNMRKRFYFKLHTYEAIGCIYEAILYNRKK